MPPVTLGCDVGSRDVGWAVLDDILLAHGVWDLHETPDGWTPEAWLVSRVGRESGKGCVADSGWHSWPWRSSTGAARSRSSPRPRASSRASARGSPWGAHG